MEAESKGVDLEIQQGNREEYGRLHRNNLSDKKASYDRAFSTGWAVVKERPLQCPKCDGKWDDEMNKPRFPIPNKDKTSKTGHRCWKCGGEA